MRTPEGLLRSLWPLWLCAVTVWLIARNTVAKSPCKCGSVSEIYTSTPKPDNIVLKFVVYYFR